jgi:hypothetical protein
MKWKRDFKGENVDVAYKTSYIHILKKNVTQRGGAHCNFSPREAEVGGS